MGRYTIAIIGLGLIGGSLALALRGFRSCVIIGCDIDAEVLDSAYEKGAIDRKAASVRDAVERADLTVFCANPAAILKDMRENIGFFKPGALITDICGVKSEIAALMSEILPDTADYVGLHPMAGKEVGGFVNAERALFHGAGFILVPIEKSGEDSISLIRELSFYAGAGRVCVNTPEEHDRIIAYTSDLMHVSAAALCASFPPDMRMTHTAGAFRDCTRIAEIDALLWTDLLSRNRGNIVVCLDAYIASLIRTRDALTNGDLAEIRGFLAQAGRNKKEMKRL